jgi:D-alanyl-D-alanine carboxypeptidase
MFNTLSLFSNRARLWLIEQGIPLLQKHLLRCVSLCGWRDSRLVLQIVIVMKRKCFFFPMLLLLTTFSFSSNAQSNQTNDIHKKEIDEYIKAEMKVEQIPALTYAIVLNNKIIDRGAYGLANVELKASVNIHSLFNIGSIGKTFTASAIMLLQKDGKLSINDAINKYLDSLPDNWKTITIKHLLSHTSGIKDYAHDFPGYSFIEKDRKQEITEREFIQEATSLPLNFQPGERWAYSNSNFVLLGFIIHKVSGKSQGEFMKERIFDPLGLKETRYTNVSKIIPNRVCGYLLDDDNKLINGAYISNFFSTMGDMGIITTATDLAKWSMALDDVKILDKQTLQQMWTSSILNDGVEAMGVFGTNYGLGWTVSRHRGYMEIGHGGSFINGYTANLARFPEKHLAVIVLTNLNPTNVSWISYNIAGFYFPELRGIDQLKAEQNGDTSLNRKVYALLDGFGNNNLDTSLVTASFKRRINPITQIVFKPEAGAEPSLYLVHTDRITNKTLSRYGAQVGKIKYYKLKLGADTHYLAIYFTADDKIADMRGY